MIQWQLTVKNYLKKKTNNSLKKKPKKKIKNFFEQRFKKYFKKNSKKFVKKILELSKTPKGRLQIKRAGFNVPKAEKV